MKQNDHTLQEAMKLFIAKAKLKPGIYEAKAREVWKEMMGPTISGYTREVSLDKDGVLKIGIESSSLRNELKFGQEKILKAMNEALGENFVKKVVIF